MTSASSTNMLKKSKLHQWFTLKDRGGNVIDEFLCHTMPYGWHYAKYSLLKIEYTFTFLTVILILKGLESLSLELKCRYFTPLNRKPFKLAHVRNVYSLIAPVCFLVNSVVNEIWWLCPVPTSTTRFASDLCCSMIKKMIGLYKRF